MSGKQKSIGGFSVRRHRRRATAELECSLYLAKWSGICSACSQQTHESFPASTWYPIKFHGYPIERDKSPDFSNHAHFECTVDSSQRTAFQKFAGPRSELCTYWQPGTNSKTHDETCSRPARRHAFRLCAVLFHSVLHDDVQHHDWIRWNSAIAEIRDCHFGLFATNALNGGSRFRFF